MLKWWALQSVHEEIEKQDVGACWLQDKMKVTQPSQGIYPSGSGSHRAQHEGIHAVCFRNLLWDFHNFECLTYSPCHLSDIPGVNYQYLFPVHWLVRTESVGVCSVPSGMNLVGLCFSSPGTTSLSHSAESRWNSPGDRDWRSCTHCRQDMWWQSRTGHGRSIWQRAGTLFNTAIHLTSLLSTDFYAKVFNSC